MTNLYSAQLDNIKLQLENFLKVLKEDPSVAEAPPWFVRRIEIGVNNAENEICQIWMKLNSFPKSKESPV